MTRPQDAPLVAALEYQHRRLAALAARAERLQAELVPPPTSWRGPARRAYEAAALGIATCLDEAVQSIRSAQGSTGSALSEVLARA